MRTYCQTTGLISLETSLKMRDRKGFSLLEILLVVAILAVALGITVPAVKGNLQRQQWNTCLSETQDYMAGIRQKAIDAGETWWVRYSLGDGVMIAGPDSGTVAEVLQLPSGFRYPSENQTGERLDATVMGFTDPEWSQMTWSMPVTFQADGSATDALIDFEGPQGRVRQMLVRGLTGRAEILPL